MECKPEVFEMDTDNLMKAQSELNIIHGKNEYYIVELCLVLRKVNTFHFENEEEGKFHKVECDV